jgi:hypothetical protein
MNPLLFLGSEYLFRMTDPTIPEEEQESYRAGLAAYLASEDGQNLSADLVRAFNEFEDSPEEITIFPRDTILWYLDWLTHQEAGLLVKVSPTVLESVWQSYDEELLRTRTIELTLLVESLQERKPEESHVAMIFNRVQGSEEVDQVSSRGYSTELAIVDALLTERSTFALRVLQSCLRHSSFQVREQLQLHIRNRANQLGPEEALELLAQVFPERQE